MAASRSPTVGGTCGRRCRSRQGCARGGCHTRGDHAFPIPDAVSLEAAFATVRAGAAQWSFRLASAPPAPGARGPAFSTQLLGQTEKAASAILRRHLDGHGLSEPQWITLVLTAGGGSSLPRPQLTQRITTAVKVGVTAATDHLDALATAGLVTSPDDLAEPVRLTDAGRQTLTTIRTALSEVTNRLWGDLEPGELATTGRVLGTILERANVELSGTDPPNPGDAAGQR